MFGDSTTMRLERSPTAPDAGRSATTAGAAAVDLTPPTWWTPPPLRRERSPKNAASWLGVRDARLAEHDIECGELSRQLTALEESTLGTLLRRPLAELERYITREEERLCREVATLRLRRRRLLASLDERRRELTEVSD